MSPKKKKSKSKAGPPHIPVEIQTNSRSSNLEIFSFTIILLGSAFFLCYIFWTFVSPFLFAAIFASACYPLVEFLERKTGFNRPISVSIVISMLFLLLFIPSIYIIVRLSQEILKVYQDWSQILTTENINEFFFGDNFWSRALQELFLFLNIPYTKVKLEEILVKALTFITGSSISFANSIFQNFIQFFIQFGIMLVALFGILWEGPRLKKFLLQLSPLKYKEEEEIIDQFNKMNNVTLVHNGIAAIIQGSMSGIGLWICGINSVLLWTVIMIVFALLPYVGTGIIFLPAAGYLYITGKPLMAVSLIVWCTLVSLILENWYKPVFMARGVSLDGFLVFFSVFGGLSTFGFVGLFYGPIILILFLTISKLYLKNYKSQ
jgi:predicted PurR-regulated permease PerM